MQNRAIVMKKWWLTGIMAAAFLTACDDITLPDQTPPVEQPSVATVVVNPQDSAWTGVLKVGQALTFAARAFAADGSELAVTEVAWGSSDSSIVVVNAQGVVQARRAGTAEVHASVKGKAGRVVIVVLADSVPGAQVAEVHVLPTTAILAAGQTRQFSARAYDANHNELFGRAVTWGSTGPENVSVTASGLALALQPGYAEITATVDGKIGSATVTVVTPPQPDPVKFVVITPGYTAVLVNQYVQLNALTLGPTGGTLSNRLVTWESENTAIATVDASGRVHGVARGTARIKATSEGVAGYANVDVRNVPSGSQQTYNLNGIASQPVNFIQIGQTTWTDANGQARAAYWVVRGGTLKLDIAAGSYQQAFSVETYLAGGGPYDPPVATQTVSDHGQVWYDFTTGLPILKSQATNSQYRVVAHGAGEYVISQSILGTAAQPWLWVIE